MYQNQVFGEIPKKNKFSLIIPFFNEGDNVGFVLEELLEQLGRTGFTYEIIPVNNGSTDNTASILEQYGSSNVIKVVNVEVNQGFGWGIRQGIQAASGEWICFFGGDGQTDPKDLIDMMNEIQNGQKNSMYTGFRIMREDGFLRTILSKIFNRLFCMMFRVHLRDINGTPKIIPASFFLNVPLEAKGWFLDAELILRARAKNMKIVECPVIFRTRKSGKTHINLSAIMEFISKMMFYFFTGGI